MPRPVYPPNRSEIMDFVMVRLAELINLRGRVGMTRDCREREQHWYEERKQSAPDVNDPKYPTWRREHDMVLKVSMAMMGASPHWAKRQMYRNDFDRATVEVEQINAQLDPLINYASMTQKSAMVDRGRNILRSAKRLPLSAFLRKLRCTNDECNEVVQTLKATQEIDVGYDTDFFYTWRDEPEFDFGDEEQKREEG